MIDIHESWFRKKPRRLYRQKGPSRSESLPELSPDEAWRAGWTRCSPRSRQAVMRRCYGVGAEAMAREFGLCSGESVRNRIEACIDELPVKPLGTNTYGIGYVVCMMVGKLGLEE